jgi:hypothetical protein
MLALVQQKKCGVKLGVDCHVLLLPERRKLSPSLATLGPPRFKRLNGYEAAQVHTHSWIPFARRHPPEGSDRCRNKNCCSFRSRPLETGAGRAGDAWPSVHAW